MTQDLVFGDKETELQFSEELPKPMVFGEFDQKPETHKPSLGGLTDKDY